MTCGIGQHVMVYSFYNPYDHRDIYECANCGKVTSRDAGPRYRYAIACDCCGVAHDHFGTAPSPFCSVGDDWECPTHGRSKISSIEVEQVAGKPTSREGANQEPSPQETWVGGVILVIVLVLVLAGCVALIR